MPLILWLSLPCSWVFIFFVLFGGSNYRWFISMTLIVFIRFFFVCWWRLVPQFMSRCRSLYLIHGNIFILILHFHLLRYRLFCRCSCWASGFFLLSFWQCSMICSGNWLRLPLSSICLDWLLAVFSVISFLFWLHTFISVIFFFSALCGCLRKNCIKVAGINTGVDVVAGNYGRRESVRIVEL